MTLPAGAAVGVPTETTASAVGSSRRHHYGGYVKRESLARRVNNRKMSPATNPVPAVPTHDAAVGTPKALTVSVMVSVEATPLPVKITGFKPVPPV